MQIYYTQFIHVQVKNYRVIMSICKRQKKYLNSKINTKCFAMEFYLQLITPFTNL